MNIEKRNAGYRAAESVEDGMVVGLGTGSTAKYAIKKIGERKKEEDLDIVGIPTSVETEKRAEKAGIDLVELDKADKIDLTIDGADEVDPEMNLIKGGGGALLREKIIAHNSSQYIVIVDASKMVDVLGESFDLPVEILSLWQEGTMDHLEKMGCKAQIRKENDAFYKTDNGNNIVDCKFGPIENPQELSRKLNSLPGVIEHGLFLDFADKIIIGNEKGFKEKF
ncbi:MAG: ribose-5-phosphate isomerase RpiA [Candidatus Thermoplasmatota archaeon]|nr:ribose-5-phosphate isomerase RpiA [Candidatus Thermoplasmatota archaeon]